MFRPMDRRAAGDAIGSAVVQGAGRLALGLQRLLGGPARSVDGQVLHPEVQLALRLMELDRRPPFETLPVGQARDWLREEARLFGGRPIPLPVVDDITIPTPEGSLGARLYRPDDPVGLLVYFHGGGWVLGDLETHDGTCRFLAKHAQCAVLAVDYRLAPEYPFPAAVIDGAAAFRHAVAHAGEWSIATGSVAVGGDSAGGNLAAVIAQLTKEEEHRPAFQLLFFPVTDLSSKHASYRLFSSGYFLTESQMDWYRAHYVPDPETSSMRGYRRCWPTT